MHHSFDITIAEKFGIEEAILIHHFQHWISLNKRLGKNLIDGRTWTYQTTKWITAHFPYLNNRQKIERILKRLVDIGILITGNYNAVKFDQTKWYAFKEENLFINGVQDNPELHENPEEKELEKIGPCKNEQSIAQKRAMGFSIMSDGMSGSGKPIPDTKYNTKEEDVCSESGAVPPHHDESIIKKFNHKSQEVLCNKSEIIRRAVVDGLEWSTSEIREAWEVLISYPGPVNDAYKFIAGTIVKIKNKKKSQYANKEKKCNSQNRTSQETYKKPTSEAPLRESVYQTWERMNSQTSASCNG